MESVGAILRDFDFKFNKQFGQNFITDGNLLDAMVADSGITSNDIVLEIGAGAGTLTRAIARAAKKVVALEIDLNLMPILSKTLAGLDDKVEVVFKDIMKISDEELLNLVGNSYKVVANLPYYITTPIIMRFLESKNPPQSLSIMVQKEVAERLIAKAGTADYGAITVAVDLVANTAITRLVKKEMFTPQPKVDSAVIKLDINTKKYGDIPIDKVKKVVKSAFAMRRKTLINNLAAITNKSKEELEGLLAELGLDAKIRGEMLDTQMFIKLTNTLY